MPEDTAFGRATLALALLAVDPGLGGLALRARAGPLRDALGPHLALLGPAARLHPGMGDEALFGGLDLTATLAAGQLRQSTGLLARPGPMVLAMAERTPPGLAARLAMVLDHGKGHCLIALDEGAEPDESLPPTLAERLAFAVDLAGQAMATARAPEEWDVAAARALLPQVTVAPDAAAALVRLADRLGVASARAPLFALRTARALAALGGRAAADEGDLARAAALVLAHRATRMPEPEAEPEAEPPPPPPEGEGEVLDLPEDLLLAAVQALLPPDLLARLALRQARAGRGAGTGATRKGNRRGRPLPARPGRPGDGARIALVATLRAAAPWQTIRRAAQPGRRGVLVRPDDLRLSRYQEQSDRLLVFAVDASGSQALTRLGEAKGAVELLLGQAYARRDHVALVAFRGTGAEVLLPPTRSLVQTKRRLAGLPGGGGTPLAAGLKAAMDVALQAGRRGLTPTIALLTDGRANIGLDGKPDRPRAAEDARAMARAIRAQNLDALVIDTGQRPEPGLADLARAMAGAYLPLPRADARRLSAAVTAALER